MTGEDHLKPESRLFQLLSLLPVLLLVLAGAAAGQEYRAEVQGIVTDPSRAAIVGARVTLKNADTGAENVKQTDTMGR
ncbi:MAG: carboxypeptidase-like regulatory domain-containing protein [Acidobacteria bacterium]|nr:carboxypeptidase-like regulatory domain-containing protein [Acidobacteriota bacterium]